MPFLSIEEHDACGIIAWLEKSALPTRDNIEHVLHALDQMRHRAGFVENEGDGSGILMDLPRAIWGQYLQEANLDPQLVEDPRFVVGHFILSASMGVTIEQAREQLFILAQQHQFTVLLERLDHTDEQVLGPGARQEGIHFYQVAMLADAKDGQVVRQNCYHLHVAIEKSIGMHTASLSPDTVVYKVRGDSATLRHYYRDLLHPLCASRATVGHNRYSTNTTTSSERVQPFTLLGHNGELNTIHRLREESRMIGIDPGIQMAEEVLDLVNRDRVAHTNIHPPTFLQRNAAINTNQLAPHIEQRPARIPGIDRGINLNAIGIFEDSTSRRRLVAVCPADQAEGHRRREIECHREGIAHRQRRITHLDLIAITERHERKWLAFFSW